MKKSILFLVAVGAGAVHSFTTNTWNNANSGNTPATAYDWSDPDNWSLGTVPGDHDSVKFPTGGGMRYVKMPSTVTVEGVRQGSANVVLIGDTFVLSSDGSTRPYLGNSVWLYADLVVGTASLPSSLVPYQSTCSIAGRIISTHHDVVSASGTTVHRMDRYATSSNPVRTDDIDIPSSNSIHPGSGSVTFYAPQGADACTGDWAQTAGSPYLSRVSGTAHPLAVGTVVSGDGIPAGTWLKRVYSDSLIELSAAAETTSASNALAFAAFTPDVRVHVPKFVRQGITTTDFKLYKYRDEDTFRFEVDAYVTGGRQINRIGLTGSELETYRPGTHVLRQVTGGTNADVLQNAHIEFAGTTSGEPTVFPATRGVCFNDADCAARLTVPDGLAGGICMLTNWVGTLVKDGRGTLTVGVGEASGSGGLVVEEGVFAITNNPAAGNGAFRIGSVSISAGATLQLPTTGLSAGALAAADGAVVSGPGTLTVESWTGGGDLGALVLTNGATLRIAGGAAGVAVHGEPEARVAGHPAFWLDASAESSIVYTTDETTGTNYVTRWNDCRAGEPMFCTNIVRRPQYLKDGTPSGTYVRIGQCKDAGRYVTNTEVLVWSEPLYDIRAVFMVQDPAEGGGVLLGRCSWRLPDRYYGSRGGPYYRGGNPVWSSPIIAPSFATPCVKEGRFFLNGEEVVGYSHGYLGAFMQLVEHHVNTDYRASASVQHLACDAFGVGYLDNVGDGTFIATENGRLRIAECIIYTNSLSYVERLETAQYLMRKWLDKDIVYLPYDANTKAQAGTFAACGEEVSVAAGKDFVVGEVTGTGGFTKTGDGTLFLKSLPSGNVRVEAGDVLLDSLSLANSSVPANAWIHMDAADESTLVTSGNSVTKWYDASGNGAYLQKLFTNNPLLVSNVLNGLPVVDLGIRNGTNKAALRYHMADGTTYIHDNAYPNYISSPYVYTAFFVYGSKGGGVSLFGCWGNGFPAQGIFPHQPTGYGAGERGAPMAYTSDYADMWSGLRTGISNGTVNVTLNGVKMDPLVTPFSGGYDLLTFDCSGNARKGDTFGSYGQGDAYVGGVEYGEILLYTNRLSSAEIARTEVYLNKKWFGKNTPGFTVAEPTSLFVSDGASVTLTGGGDVFPAAIGGAGAVTGDVHVPVGGALIAEVAADGSVAGPLAVNGAADLSKGGVVSLAGDVAKLAPGDWPLLTASPLAADAAAWTCESPSRMLSCRVVVSGNSLVLRVLPRGTIIMFR